MCYFGLSFSKATTSKTLFVTNVELKQRDGQHLRSVEKDLLLVLCW